MLFQIIDWNDRCIFHDYDSDNNEKKDEAEEKYYYSIQIFGKNEKEQSICLNVFNIFPYFYIKNAYIYIKDKHKFTLNTGSCEIEISQFYLNEYENIRKHDYTNFKNDLEEKFLKLSFKSPIYLYKIKKQLQENNIQLFESNVNGIIQFIHDNKLSGCSWISIDDDELELIEYDKISKCDLEYNLYDNKEISVVEKDEIVRLKICSYDIEVTSEDGSFPQAIRSGDKIIQIGMTFNYFQEQNCYKKYLLNLHSCDPIENTEVICVDNELDLIEKFISIINKEDPDVICGYNIFGFDNKYMHDRSLEDEHFKEMLSTMSRLNEPQKFITKELSSSALGDNILYYFHTPGRVMIDLLKVVRNSFSLEKYSLDFVSSYLISGDITDIQKNYFISNTNELEIDSFCFIKILDTISNTEELFEHKLKIVKIENNKFFFKGDISNLSQTQKQNIKWCLAKDDLSPQDIFDYFKKTSYHRFVIGKYCVKDCVLVNKLMEKIDVVSNSIAMANVCKVPWNYIFLRGQGIKAFSLIKYQANSQNYLFPTITKDSIINKKKNLSQTDYKIINKNCCNEACITNNNIYKNSKIAVIQKNEYNIQNVCLECNQVQYNTKYDGAHVIDPIPGYYTDPIIVMDFASLYPSSIIQKNMSGETQIMDTKYLSLPNCEYYDVEYNEENKKKKCCFVKKNNKLGVIPTTLQNLLSERKAIKKKMKKETNEFKKKILDGQQLAMKITANSIYGQMGAITSPIYLKDIAASTTATGKEMLLKAQTFMEEELEIIFNNKTLYQNILEQKDIDFIETFKQKYTINPQCIYGDTDSVFISLNIKDIKTKKLQQDLQARENSIRIGMIAEKLASSCKDKDNPSKNLFPDPQFLEYEKVYHKWAIFSKKKYTGRLYESDPNKFYVNNMGIVLKRRDNAKIVKKICGSILHIMFSENDYATKCKLFVKNIMQEMFDNKFDISYFVITKTLRSTYKGKKLTDKKYKCDCSYILNETVSDKTFHKKSCKSIAKIGDKGTWKWDDCNCSIAHVKLCQRMKKRDIGSAPNANDRISYVYIVNKQKNILQGDRIEELSYVKKNKLQIDYQFYIDNQIANPSIQFLELFITNPEYLFTNCLSENNTKQMKITSYF